LKSSYIYVGTFFIYIMPDLIPNQPNRPFTPQEKKDYLLHKYTKRDYKIEDLESCKKYAVYFNPAIDKVNKWTLLCICETELQCKEQILWRKNYIEFHDTELVINNDPQFSSFHNELLNIDPKTNKPFEPGEELMKLNYNSSENLLQIIADSPLANPSTGFKSMCYYSNIEIGNYQGTYEIREYYQL
jgi:hypothetical protein